MEDVKEPLDTITAQDRFGLVTIYGTEYQIVDIGLRQEALSESGAGATLWKCCVSADTDGTGKSKSERIMRCEAAAELPGGSSGRGCGRAVEICIGFMEV